MEQSFQYFDFLTATLIFAAYLVIDVLYAKYTYAVVGKKPIQAANIGFVMHFLAKSLSEISTQFFSREFDMLVV